MSDTWTLGDRQLRSRIIVGTGKYASLEQTKLRWRPRAPRS